VACDEFGVHDWEGVAEEEVGENFDDVADEVEFVAFLEEFEEEEDEGGCGVDREGD
jgi:hypothetical protein